MGKSLGNVLNPVALVSAYGADAVRFYFLKEIEFGQVFAASLTSLYHTRYKCLWQYNMYRSAAAAAGIDTDPHKCLQLGHSQIRPAAWSICLDKTLHLPASALPVLLSVAKSLCPLFLKCSQNVSQVKF